MSQDSTWEIDNLPVPNLITSSPLIPDESLPNSKALKIELRKVPKMVLTEKYQVNSNIEDFSYLYLLLSGTWRSDEEMKAGQETWQKALEFHGLSIPDDDGILQYYKALIKFMLESPRYSPYDIVRTISMMNFDMKEYLENLKSMITNEQKENVQNIINELISLDHVEEHIESINVEPSIDMLNEYINFQKSDEERTEAEQKLNGIIPELNKDQKYIFDEISKRLEAKQQVTSFIQGKAGTGKSFLIHTLIYCLTSKKIPFIVCASTGIAASLIGGNTVHSSFGLYTQKNRSNEIVLCSLDVTKPNGFAMTYVQVIIIDEITMISGKVLNAIDSGLRKIMAQVNSPHHDMMFGGKSLLLFGDLAQVPAVSNTYDDLNEVLNQFHESDSYVGFIKWELKQLMRQNENEDVFIKLLDYIRSYNNSNIIDEDILKELKNLFIPGSIEHAIDEIDNFLGNDSPNGMAITFTNKMAQVYNQLILDKRAHANGYHKIVLNAKFYIRINSSFIANQYEDHLQSIERQRAITKIQCASQSDIKIFCAAMKKRQVNSIIPFSVSIIPGARIILLQNLDVKNGLINGARGKVIEYIENVDSLSIKFDFQKDDEMPILITRRKSVEYQINDGKMIFMYQFPIKLAWAITAHKCQGQTLERAAIHIGENAFAHGSFYVAFSRVKSLGNIRLFGLENWPEKGPEFHVNPFIQAKQDSQAENEFI